MNGFGMIEFRLHSEGSNENPIWGIAFRHRNDVAKALDNEINKRPSQIDIEFPDGKTYTFGIRPSFWNGCYEFVDAQVRDKESGRLLREVKPTKSSAIDTLRYNTHTKGNCIIHVQVVERNQLLRILTLK